MGCSKGPENWAFLQSSPRPWPRLVAALAWIPMCNLYSITKGQAAIIAFTRAMRDLTGNLPPMPGVFPDYAAPIVRNGPDGVRELMLARWGMPGPPQFGGAPITNIRNTASPHWRAWLKTEHRCVVPFTSFCEYADTKPRKTPTGSLWMESDRWRSSPAYGRPGTDCAAPRPIQSKASISSSGFSPRTPTPTWARSVRRPCRSFSRQAKPRSSG
jgi:hypothetical protein